MKTNHKTRTDLINHLSRLEGQLASLKRQLKEEEPDCTKVSSVLCAASRSFASLRRTTLDCFLTEKGIGKKLSTKQAAEYQALLNIVNS